MSPKVNEADRETRILEAAAAVIIRLGYDKTTMGDIAEAAGVSRGITYLHFADKQRLFEAVIRREVLAYIRAWQDFIEADPQGGTMGGIYRAVLRAINSRPFMAALLRRDPRVLGRYLRQPGHLFAALPLNTIGTGLVRDLQACGAIRRDLDPALTSHILDTLSYGLVSVPEFKAPDALPPFDATLAAMAQMLDDWLTPPEGANRDAGKQVIRALVTQVLAQLETGDAADPSLSFTQEAGA